MKSAKFRFYEELNDFLVSSRRKVSFDYSFSGDPKIKDVIEMIGVPHTEIDLILVNGVSVNFDYRLANADTVSVYPVFETFDISSITHLHPAPLRDVKFILDVHLGRLTKYLRICGFDCYYENLDDDAIIRCSLAEKRIILTKDKGLLKNKKVTHGYWVRSTKTKQQLLEVFNRFDLIKKVQFLVRCLLCNCKLQEICKKQVGNTVPERIIKYYDIFYFCPGCHKIYWKGSHYKNMLLLFTALKKTVLEKEDDSP
jgi:uncharacterized protein